MALLLIGVAVVLAVGIGLSARLVRRSSDPSDLAITEADLDRAKATSNEFLADLRFPDRRRVQRAVTRGRTVTDASLAAAAVAVAYSTWLVMRVQIARPRWIRALAPAFFTLSGTARLASTEPMWQHILDISLVILMPWLIFETVIGPKRSASRAKRSEQLNLALLTASGAIPRPPN